MKYPGHAFTICFDISFSAWFCRWHTVHAEDTNLQGVVAHTSRFWRSLRRGCIPVTFFRAYELPFADAIDYSTATVNIQPDNIATMSSVLTDILNNPAKLLSLQQNVEKVQNMIVWEGQGYNSSVQQLFWDALSRRSEKMYRYAVGDIHI